MDKTIQFHNSSLEPIARLFMSGMRKRDRNGTRLKRSAFGSGILRRYRRGLYRFNAAVKSKKGKA